MIEGRGDTQAYLVPAETYLGFSPTQVHHQTSHTRGPLNSTSKQDITIHHHHHLAKHTQIHLIFSNPPSSSDIMTSSDTPLLDPGIFDHLKSKLDEETEVRDTLSNIVQRLERAVSSAQAILSRVHSTPRARCMVPYPPRVELYTVFLMR